MMHTCISGIIISWHIRIDEVEMACRLQTKHRDLVCEQKEKREATIKTIRTTAENLVTHHWNVNISRIIGSLIAIVGSGIAILGFALTPVTFSALVGVKIAGVAIARTGGVTTTKASIVDTIIIKTGKRSTGTVRVQSR